MNQTRLPKDYCNLKFEQPIKRWDEALMLGNGKIGCLIWGESEALRLSLDRGDIWDKTPYPGVLEEGFTYQRLVELVQNKEVETIRKQFDAPYYNPTPTKLPAGKLIIKGEQVENIISTLELATATAHLQVGDSVSIATYLHATKESGFIRIIGDVSKLTIEIESPEFGKKEDDFEYAYDAEGREISQGSLKQLKYEAVQWKEEEGIKYFIQKVDETLSYGILLAQKKVASGLECVYRVITYRKGEEEEVEKQKSILKKHLAEGYEGNWEEHKNWWYAFWNKSFVSLPDKTFEKQWYLTNYFLGSASRKGAMPMPLQGVWTADDGMLPPWKGDYHHDLNTQMTYYHYLKANHLEEGESFIDFLWNLVPVARAFAKSFYGVEGICLPAVMAIDGTPLGGWPMYSLSPTQQLWLCQAFERHYRFTGDKVFLEEKAYPYLSESGKFILSLLKQDEMGKFVLPVSSSSEIHDDELEAWITPNSNYDLSLMIYLFRALKQMARELKNGEEKKWEEILERFHPLAINKDHVLMIGPDESLMESHRHFAHAMPIHPLRLLDYEKEEDKKVIDGTVLNLELLGSGLWVGFSFTWMAELFAIQKNGEGAYYQLKLFWENFCSQNGFHLNGDYKRRGLSQFHYRPFTLEANFCAADALQEMLLQTDYEGIELFPAIPEAWRDEEIGFEDFRGERGILIGAVHKQGRVSTITLEPRYEGEYIVKGIASKENIVIKPECEFHIKDNTIKLELKAQKRYEIIML